METPTPPDYTDFTDEQLFVELQGVEAELCELHARRAQINKEEESAQEARKAIQRALGILVLDDRRTNVPAATRSHEINPDYL